MIGPLVAFLSSSAGGALIGWIQSHQEQKRADRLRKEQQDHEKFMAARQDSLDLYDRSVAAAQIKPLRYVQETRRKQRAHFLWFWRWGEPAETFKRVEVDRLSRTPREKTIATVVLMFAATYCVVTLWVGFWFMADVSIIPPGSKQAGIDLVLFKLKFGGNKPVPQAVLGPLLYMLSSPMFFVSNWAIRKNPNR